MPSGLDFLAIISRPDLPSGTGPVGDYYALHQLVERHPEWRAMVLELNHHEIDVSWDDTGFWIHEPDHAPVNLIDVKVALYVPVCLEIEETQLAIVDPSGPWPRFATENWRPVSTFAEACLNRQRCLNRPESVRAANNKLLQLDTLRRAGFSLPETVISRGAPSNGPLAQLPMLVAKNASEGGWKSPTEFSPARLVDTQDAPVDPWPTIWQEPLTSDTELRIYVMGNDVVTAALTMDPRIVDVRATHDGRPVASITELRTDWRDLAIAVTRALGLDYAVLDAIPVGDTLHVLEVNANGVWWFLPADVGAVLETRFHAWIESEVCL